VRATVLTIGAALVISFAAWSAPAPGVMAQVAPSPSPVAPVASPAGAPAPAPAPAASPVASPAPATPAPRAGGFPLELAWPMVAGGAAAVGAGALLLRRARR